MTFGESRYKCGIDFEDRTLTVMIRPDKKEAIIFHFESSVFHGVRANKRKVLIKVRGEVLRYMRVYHSRVVLKEGELKYHMNKNLLTWLYKKSGGI